MSWLLENLLDAVCMTNQQKGQELYNRKFLEWIRAILLLQVKQIDENLKSFNLNKGGTTK
jgi:hypothetical protein